MKNIFRKFMSIMMVSCLFLSIPHLAYAKTDDNQNLDKKVLFTVDIKTEKELEIFLADLDKHNKNSQNLWKEALKHSEEELKQSEEKLKQSEDKNIETLSSNEITLAATSGLTTARTTKSLFIGNGWRTMGAYTTYNKTEYIAGVPIFGQVYNIVVYGQTDDAVVSDLITDYTRIDNERTLAVSASYLVGVKNYGGSTSYYPMYSYIEFYASGGGYWF